MSGKSTRRKSTTKAKDKSKPETQAKAKAILRWFLLAVICAVFVVNYEAVFDSKLDPNGDNITYFLLAKALSEGQGYTDILSPASVQHTHFPPGYPLFMSVFMHFFPDNVVAMKILNGILFLLAVLLLFRIVRKTTGGNIYLAFAVCLLTVSHPILLRWATIMMSEPLYIVISFGIILISLDLDIGKVFTRGHKDRRQIARLVLLCLLVMSSYLVRTMGISVVLAAILAFGVTSAKAFFKKNKSWWKPALTAAAICLSLVVVHEGWSIRNHKVANGFHSDYSAGFMYTDSQERMTPELWKERIVSNTTEFVTIWIPRSILKPLDVIDYTKHDKPAALDWTKGLLVILLSCFGISRMKKGRVLLLSYILITFAVLVLYQEQYAGVRYFVPVLPLLLLTALNGIFELLSLAVKALFKRDFAVVPILAMAAVVVLLYNPYMEGQKFYKSIAGYKNYSNMNPGSSFANYIEAAEWLKDHVGNNAVIACRKPEVMYMYSGYKYAVRFPTSGSEEEILGFFKSSNANCLVLDTWAKHAYNVIIPVIKKYPDAFPVYYVTEPDKKTNAPTIVAAILPSKIENNE